MYKYVWTHVNCTTPDPKIYCCYITDKQMMWFNDNDYVYLNNVHIVKHMLYKLVAYVVDNYYNMMTLVTYGLNYLKQIEFFFLLFVLKKWLIINLELLTLVLICIYI